MNSFVGYMNYGCLGAEKRVVYSANCPIDTAVCSDKIIIELPEQKDWSLYEGQYGDVLVSTSWGYNYRLNDVLCGDKYPYFEAYDDRFQLHRLRLKFEYA